MKNLNIILLSFAMLTFSVSFGQYNQEAKGKNRIYTTETVKQAVLDEKGEEVLDSSGAVLTEDVEVEVQVEGDSFGNANGSEFDLATDGAFTGNTVAVLHLYTGEGFDFEEPKAALEQKGFSVFRWINNPPSAEELKLQLENASQLWVISDASRKLNDEHAEVIKEFFESGKGLYIWGDNSPYYADANFLCQKIFNTTMDGNTWAGKVVKVSGEAENRAGIVEGHLISTGVSNMYEGITVATVTATQELSPLIYGSEDNLIAAVYEQDGKRAIIDGGFTRLYYSWDSAGTHRYVKNAASWLVNYERFGELVYQNQEEDLDTDDEKEPELEEIKKEDDKDSGNNGGDVIIKNADVIRNELLEFNGNVLIKDVKN